MHAHTPHRLAVLCLIVAALPSASAEEVTLAGARAHLTAERWAEAARAYEILSGDHLTNASVWAGLGRAYRGLGQLEDSQIAYENAITMDAQHGAALLGLASVLAERGSADEAIGRLEELARTGASPVQLQQHPGLASLRQHPRFAEVLAVARRASQPCLHETPYDDFDFWLGTWDVHAGGRKQARNVITREMDGCIVRERYENATGYRGESINYYDPDDDRWKQTWVDGRGGIVRYEGGLRSDGVMYMEGTNTNSGGDTELARVTWTRLADGGVHHVIEQSKDGGASWYVYFDGTYVRAGGAGQGATP